MKMIAAVSLTLLLVPAVQAFNPQPEPPGFGMLGVVASQTARLNVSYTAPPEPDRAAFPPGPCRGELHLQFVDQAGSVLMERTVRLPAGASTALEYSSFGRLGGDVPGGAGLRTQIRAIVSWSEFPPGPCREGALFGNVEVYNTESGATQFVLPGTLGAFQDVDRPQR